MKLNRDAIALALLLILGYVSIVRADFGAPWGIRWVRNYRGPQNEFTNSDMFYDVYAIPGGGYALCGRDHAGGVGLHSGFGWLLVTDEDGDIIFNRAFVSHAGPATNWVTVIQTGDEGFLVGGGTAGRFQVAKTDDEGNTLWWNNYAGDGRSWCYAVIELKQGNYLACGRADDRISYAVMIDENGEIVWEREYEGHEFRGVREVEDGLVFANRNPYTQRDNEFLKTDFNGDVMWRNAQFGGHPSSLVRTHDGGFLTVGVNRFNLQNNEESYPWLVMAEADGEIVWSRTHEIDRLPRRTEERGFCVAKTPGGYFIVGDIITQGLPQGSCELYLNAGFQPIWGRADLQLPDNCHAKELQSVIAKEDGSVIICGRSSNQNGTPGGLVVSLIPERLPPEVIERGPEPLDVYVLVGDTVAFWVRAVDPQEDSVRYLWFYEGDQISDSTSVVLIFEQLGDFDLDCVVSDGVFSDTSKWRIHSEEFVISGQIPASQPFVTRRNRETEYSLSIRSHRLDDLEYFWLLAEEGDEGEGNLVSNDEQISLSFPERGLRRLTVVVVLGEVIHNRTWDIEVLSPIGAWNPIPLDLEVGENYSLVFTISPYNPENLRETFRWNIGEGWQRGDSIFSVLFDEARDWTVGARLTLGNDSETDEVYWDVSVRDTGVSVSDWIHYPLYAGLSAYPNPFNSTTTITFSTGSAARPTRLAIYDLQGRLVADLTNSAFRTPHSAFSKVVWDAVGFPAGIYIVRLQYLDNIQTAKIVHVR